MKFGTVDETLPNLADLGEPQDEYERAQIAMCENDPGNTKLHRIIIKHLTARRQHIQQFGRFMQ